MQQQPEQPHQNLAPLLSIHTRHDQDWRVQAWEKAEIPARFWDMTLDSSPLVKTAPALIKRLTYPAEPDNDRKSTHEVIGKDGAISYAYDDPSWKAYIKALQDFDGSWFFHGAFGVGKTGLAVGYAREWLRRDEDNHGILFRSLPKLLAEIRATYNKSDSTTTEGKLLTRYQRLGLFILDDIGSEQVTSSGWMEDRLYQIIGDRHDEEMPMVFTSNLTLEQLAKRIGERLTWRILEMCGQAHIIEVKGRNLRDVAAK